MSITKDSEKSHFTTASESGRDPVPDPGGHVGFGTVVNTTAAGSQALHRKLRGKEVQLFAIGGAIGTCKYSTFQDRLTIKARFV